MLGSDKSRGYCLEMICADFLAGAHLEEGMACFPHKRKDYTRALGLGASRADFAVTILLGSGYRLGGSRKELAHAERIERDGSQQQKSFDTSERRVRRGTSVIALAGHATTAEQGSEAMTAFGLDNPATAYPRPPFKKQFQSRPGLASEMDPVPDHGENGDRGSGRLQGRKAKN